MNEEVPGRIDHRSQPVVIIIVEARIDASGVINFGMSACIIVFVPDGLSNAILVALHLTVFVVHPELHRSIRMSQTEHLTARCADKGSRKPTTIGDAIQEAHVAIGICVGLAFGIGRGRHTPEGVDRPEASAEFWISRAGDVSFKIVTDRTHFRGLCEVWGNIHSGGVACPSTIVASKSDFRSNICSLPSLPCKTAITLEPAKVLISFPR